MDWQGSGNTPEKLLNNAELEAALKTLDTASAMALLERQAELRRVFELEQVRLAQEAEAQRAAQEAQRIIEEQLAAERAAEQAAQAAAAEAKRIAEEREAAVRAEAERLAAEEAARLAEIAEQARAEAELEAARVAQAEAERLAREQAEAEARQQALAAAEAEQQAAAEKLAAEQAEVAAKAAEEAQETQGFQPASDIDELLQTNSVVEKTENSIADSLNSLYSGASTSAEEAATAEAEQELDVVDQIIVGFPEADKTEAAEQKGNGVFSTIVNWAGSGALLTATILGFILKSTGVDLFDALAGSMLAFAVIAVAYSGLVVVARRGRNFTSVLSRGVFGVSGNIVTSAVLKLIRIGALGSAFYVAAKATGKLLPENLLPSQLQIADFQIAISVAQIAAIALIATLLSFIRVRTTEIIRSVLAAFTFVAIAALAAAGIMTDIMTQLGAFDYLVSVAAAALVIATYSVLWLSSAADELQNLSSGMKYSRVLLSSLGFWLVVAPIAVFAGFILSDVSELTSLLLPIAAALLFAMIFALAAQGRQVSNFVVGLRASRTFGWVIWLVALAAAALAGYFEIVLGDQGTWRNLSSYLPAMAIPVLAWLGLLLGDATIRRIDFHQVSLQKNYGFYGGWNFSNLIAWVVISALGFGLVILNVVEFAWAGFILKLLPIPTEFQQVAWGLWVALLVGYLYPIATGRKKIRRQESEVSALLARKDDLREVVGLVD